MQVLPSTSGSRRENSCQYSLQDSPSHYPWGMAVENKANACARSPWAVPARVPITPRL